MGPQSSPANHCSQNSELPVQPENLAQGNKAENNRAGQPVSCSSFHTHSCACSPHLYMCTCLSIPRRHTYTCTHTQDKPRCRETGPLCWWYCEIMQPPWQIVCQFRVWCSHVTWQLYSVVCYQWTWKHFYPNIPTHMFIAAFLLVSTCPLTDEHAI